MTSVTSPNEGAAVAYDFTLVMGGHYRAEPSWGDHWHVKDLNTGKIVSDGHKSLERAVQFILEHRANES